MIRGKCVHKSLRGVCDGTEGEQEREGGGRIKDESDRISWQERREEGGEERRKKQDSAHASSATFNGELWSQITPRLTTRRTMKRNRVR